jgi:hypothetical protein
MTFSIVARDPTTGDLGVAVASTSGHRVLAAALGTRGRCRQRGSRSGVRRPSDQVA